MLSPSALREPLDLCASSVSSASLTPPRPDSPRPTMDAAAQARARLRQLVVWSDAAEEERDEEEDQRQPPIKTLALRDAPRLEDRAVTVSITRRRSLFCAMPARGCRMWERDIGRRNSIRRGKSFHRYTRVEGRLDGRLDAQNHPPVDDFDDLVDGLDATKVTETPISPPLHKTLQRAA